MENPTDDYLHSWSNALKGNSGVNEAACNLSLSISVLSSTSQKRPKTPMRTILELLQYQELPWIQVLLTELGTGRLWQLLSQLSNS